MPTLSDAERDYIIGGAVAGVRSDGRGLLDRRPITLETGVLPTASGSARVRVGGVTDVLVGVTAELGTPATSQPALGLIDFSVECSSLASPDFTGRGAEDLNAELTVLLTRLYAGPATRALRASLCLIPGAKCWVLRVDTLVLDSGGCLADAASLGVRAALRTALLPRVRVIAGEADDPDEVEVDAGALTTLRDAASAAPVAVTVCILGGALSTPAGARAEASAPLADATSDEAACAGASLTVGVGPRGTACGVASSGGHGAGIDALAAALRAARALGVDAIARADAFVDDALRARDGGAPHEPVGFFLYYPARASGRQHRPPAATAMHALLLQLEDALRRLARLLYRMVKRARRAATGTSALARIACGDAAQRGAPRALRFQREWAASRALSAHYAAHARGDMDVDAATRALLAAKAPGADADTRARVSACVAAVRDVLAVAGRVEALRAEAFVPGEAAHEGLLERVWGGVMPGVERGGRVTREWGMVGFQGTDPVSDLRGGGMLGLVQLAWMAEARGEAARRMVREPAEEERRYPWACAGIGVTMRVVDALRAGGLDALLYAAAQRLGEGGPVDVSARCDRLLGVVHDVYGDLFEKLHSEYVAARPENVLAYPPVFERAMREGLDEVQSGGKVCVGGGRAKDE